MRLIDLIEKRGYRVIFGWTNKKTYAFIYFDRKIIKINPFLFFANTFFHELYHLKYEDRNFEEDKIQGKTDNLIEKKMTVREIKDMGRTLISLFLTSNPKREEYYYGVMAKKIRNRKAAKRLKERKPAKKK